MTEKDFEEIARDSSGLDITHDHSEEYYKQPSYIEKWQQKYIETHEKINGFDILTSIRRGEYKEIFNSYINYCLEKGKKPEAKHLFNIYYEIKIYLTTNIALDTFTNICEGAIIYKEFFNDFENLPTADNFSLIADDWKKYENSNVNITYSKLLDILKDTGFAIEKEISKIDILFLKYIDLIDEQKKDTIEGKKKALADDEFKDYRKEYLTPQIIADLINAGQLEQEMVNYKYKPITGIKIFMDWLSNNGYEDYLNFNFFKKFIFYENTDNSIRQYLKPCNHGVKRKKRK